MAERTKSRETRLTRGLILQTALRLVDAEGVEALSMRKLAAELGVNPMSLYHHVENKAALLEGVGAMVTAGTRDLVLAPGTWRRQLFLLAGEYRALSMQHPHLMRWASSKGEFVERGGTLWRALGEILRGAGLPDDEAEKVGAVLAALVGALLMTEATGALRRLSDEEDGGFATAVWLLIDGVAARVDGSATPVEGGVARVE